MRIYRNQDVLWRDEDDQRKRAYERLSMGENVEDMGTSILFSDGMMLSLNLLGTEIWKLCDGKTAEEIISELLHRFDVDEEVLKQDTMNFLHELSQKGFNSYEQ